MAPLLDLLDIHDYRRVPLNQAQRAAMPGDYPYYGANGQVDTVGDYLFDGDFILLAEDGGFFDQPGRPVAYEAAGKFWVNNHAHILSAQEGVSQPYLAKLLNSIDWLPFVSGTTRLKLTQGGMQRASVPLPPTAEQRRIVAKLDVLTARLARARPETDGVQRLSARIRTAALAAWFSEDRVRSWPCRSMGDLVADGLIGLIRAKAEQGGDGVPYIRMNHFDMDGRWNARALTCVRTSAEEQRRFELQPGDVLFNTRNSLELVGKVAMWPDGKPGFVYNNNLLRLRFMVEIHPPFACFFMMSPQFRAAMEQEKSATTSVAAIYQRSLYAAQMPVPTLDEQRYIAAKLNASFARADRLEAEVSRARALLDRLESTLLAKAFRGELVPQDLEDEPASELLERIRARRAVAPKAKRGRRPRATTDA